MAWDRDGKKYIYIPQRGGGQKLRSVGKVDARTADRWAAQLRELRDLGRWVVLDAVLASRLAVPDAVAALREGRAALEALEARLTAQEIAPHLDAWQRWAVASGAVREAKTYRRQVDALLARYPDVRTFADVTLAMAETWKADLVAEGRKLGTVRRHWYALKSLTRYAVTMGLLRADPLAGRGVGRKPRARERWESAETDERIVRATTPKWRAFFAFVHGTGADVSAALALRVGDFDLTQGTAHVRATKTDARDRVVIIEPWALPYLRSHLAGRDATELAFPRSNRTDAAHAHQAARLAVGVENYTLRDARHSVAVRALTAGLPPQWVADQLGHADTTMVHEVYGKHTLTLAQRLAARDLAHSRALVGSETPGRVSQSIQHAPGDEPGAGE